MRRPHKQIGTSLILAGSLCVLAAVIVGGKGLEMLPAVGWCIVLLGAGTIALAKGQSPLWCLLGPLGVLVIALIEDKRPEASVSLPPTE